VKNPVRMTVYAAVAASGMFGTLPAAHAATGYIQDFGGKPGMTVIVNDFVDNVLADPRINFYFKTTNIPALKAALTQQFCKLEGGGCSFDLSMKAIHQNLGITQAAFNALAEDLMKSMNAHDVPQVAQNNLVAKLAAMEPRIVTK
jgi:hemoglobin